MSKGMFNRMQLQELLKEGSRHYFGSEVLLRNIEAVTSLAELSRTSMGPNGMNKMVQNQLDKLFVTHDTATMMREIEVIHPAAKIVVLAAQAQEKEVGDGTNFVVSLCGELMENAEGLLRIGLHPNDIVAGYTLAQKKAIELLEKELIVDSVKDLLSESEVAKAMRAALSSKLSTYADTLAPIIARACIEACPTKRSEDDTRAVAFNPDNVRVIKVPGGSVGDTNIVRGFAVARNVAGTIRHVRDARIAVLSVSLEAGTTDTKSTVLIKSADELKSYNVSEENAMERDVKAMADAGVNVVVTQGSFSEMALHFLERYKIMAIKVPSKWQVRRLCRAVGATIMARVGKPTAEELGRCETVDLTEIGDQNICVFRDPVFERASRGGLATIVVRGATSNVMDEVERAVDDAVNVFKTLTREPRLVAGAGSVELALHARLAKLADETPGLEQYAIRKFAESLLVVPRTLCESAGFPTTDALASLTAKHAAGSSTIGVDLDDIEGQDAVANGIFDLLLLKTWGIKLSTKAVTDILTVDQIIMARPAGGPKPPKGQGHWDDTD